MMLWFGTDAHVVPPAVNETCWGAMMKDFSVM